MCAVRTAFTTPFTNLTLGNFLLLGFWLYELLTLNRTVLLCPTTPSSICLLWPCNTNCTNNTN